MSFLANPPAPDEDEETPVSSGGWYPDIVPARLRETARLDGTVTPSRLRYSLITAIASIDTELRVWMLAQQLAGHATLAAVPAPQIDGASIKVHQYLRAVYSYVQADLIDRYRDFDTTGAGDKKAETLEQTCGDFRRDVRWAVSDILGIRRSTVELI